MRVTAGDLWGAGRQFAESNPELAVLAAVCVVLAVGTAYALFRYRRPAGVRFKRQLEKREEVAVLMHPNPDPDAMAAALGVACLAEQLDTAVTLQFTGQIRHQENRAFQNVLDLEFEQVDHVTDLAAEAVILVDHNTPRGFTGSNGVLPFAVVDHHPGDGTGEAFTDVRTDYGACSSIVAEYFEDIGASPVPPDQHESEVNSRYTVPSRVATGLLYGILTDTNRLTSGCSTADFHASGYLYPGVDEDDLERIANPQVDAEVLEVKARAIAGRRTEGSFAVSDVGQVTNADAIPQAAEELVRLEGVTAVVVCGEKGGDIHLSGRSRDDRVHMGRALEAAVEGIPGASAGGHARMGGGQIPEDETAVLIGNDSGRVARTSLVDRIFESLSGDV
ncbi:MAG: bifunctional oligoribonuclease/PAP phosphatase NrnA [Haloferacaceae archaeon]